MSKPVGLFGGAMMSKGRGNKGDPGVGEEGCRGYDPVLTRLGVTALSRLDCTG